MAVKTRISSLALIVALVSISVWCSGQLGIGSPSLWAEEPSSSKSVTRFATNEFVAGCRVRPEALIVDPYFGLLPIHTYLPEPVSLRRLDRMQIEELGVFCGPQGTQDADIEWAAAARTSKRIELEAVMKQWRKSLVPKEKPTGIKPVALKIADQKCFQVPAGSFFPPPRKYGTLRFTDAKGNPAKKGVNVGNFWEYRSYVEGKTNASAIFTFDQLDETDLIDGHLPLELRLDVFHTYKLDKEYATAQMELRNPDTGLRSLPITFKAKSYVNCQFEIPRKLTALDANGQRPGDLLKDFCSKNGRLEVILTGIEQGIYFGVGDYDLNVRPLAFEYVYVSGREIVVAQSKKTLEKMLRASKTPTSLAKRLSQPGEIVIAAHVRNDSQRTAFQQLAHSMSETVMFAQVRNDSQPSAQSVGDNANAKLWGATLTEMTAIICIKEPKITLVKAKFQPRRNAEKAARLCKQMIGDVRDSAHKHLGETIKRIDNFSNLVSLSMDGVLLSFPRDSLLTAEVRERSLLKLIDEALDKIQVEVDGNSLTLTFMPLAMFSNLPMPTQYALANMEERMARTLLTLEKFDLGDELFERMTYRFPQAFELWFRRAHQLVYNTSFDFDGDETRYSGPRRGINLLLDGAKQNPGTTDLLWMAARFVDRKLGSSYDGVPYRELFSHDERLHKRLAKYIDLEQAKSPNHKIDNWLVAKLLFEHCIEQHEKAGASSTISPLLFFSRPAATQARYAASLADSGHWNESQKAWKEAERLHLELGKRTFFFEDGKRIQLQNFPVKLAQLGPKDPAVQRLQWARRRIRYDYFLTQCQFEQIDKVQAARKLKYQAEQHAKQSEWKPAMERYQQSLQTLAELHKQHPKPMTLLAGEFSDIAKGYQKTRKHVEATEHESLAPILKLIERSHALSDYPLLYDPPKDGESFDIE